MDARMPATQTHFDFALMPTSKGVRLLSFVDGKLRHAMPTGLAHCQRHAWLDEGSLAVLTHPMRKRAGWQQVRIFRCEENRALAIGMMKTPILAADLIGFQGRLVICGTSDSHSRAFILDAFPEERWKPLEMSPELEWGRKGIDALASDGHQLIAIDNIVLPKWLVRYVPAEDAVPQLADVVQLPQHGSYEHIRTASSGATLFSLHSTTVGREGAFGHVAMYRFDSLAPVGSITFAAGRIAHVMQGDTLWLLHSGHPDCIFRLALEQLDGRNTPLQRLLASSACLALPQPCETIIRSRYGHLFAIPQDDAAAPIPLKALLP